MQCASCQAEVCGPGEAFTGDVCPQCRHFAHPTRLGIYEDLELIKRGGMGSVYRARHPKLGTTVAIKSVQTNTGPMTLAERFEREAALAARIPHPGIVRVYDYDCQEGRLYLVMEFVEGQTLRQHVQEGGRELAWCLDKVAQLADILQAAHDQGIVHRDIKPENVMVEPTGKVRLLDLGVSCVIEGEDRLTQPGEILGTPEYISPEQILEAPEAIDARADVYSMGLVLYELLTGRSPFAGSNLFQVLKYVESLTPPRPSERCAEMTPELDTLVMECLAKDPADRPTSAGSVARRLRSFAPTSGTTKTSRGLGVWVGGALLIAGVVVGLGVAPYVVGAPERSGTGRAIPAPPSPQKILATVLSSGGPIDVGSVIPLAHRIPDDAEPAAVFQRGLAFKHCGALFLAHRDFVSLGGRHPEAELESRLLWIYKHQLYPIVLGGPRWLMSQPATEAVAQGDGLLRGLSALQHHDLEGAERGVQSSDWRAADRHVVLALIAFLQGDRVRAMEALRRGSADYLPHRMLAAVLDPRGAADRLRELMPFVDRSLPMRYFLEAAIAMRGGNLQRLRAATELALVSGEAASATSVYLAARVWLGNGSLGRQAADLMQLAPKSEVEQPGLAHTLAVLTRASGETGNLPARLAELPPDPFLAFFTGWSSGEDGEFYAGLCDALFVGRRVGQVGRQRLLSWLGELPAVVEDETQLARGCLAVSVLGSRSGSARVKVRDGLVVAAKSANDFELFRRFLTSSPCRAIDRSLFVEALHECLQQGVPNARIVPLLQVVLEIEGGAAALLANQKLASLHPAVLKLLPGGRDG